MASPKQKCEKCGNPANELFYCGRCWKIICEECYDPFAGVCICCIKELLEGNNIQCPKSVPEKNAEITLEPLNEEKDSRNILFEQDNPIFSQHPNNEPRITSSFFLSGAINSLCSRPSADGSPTKIVAFDIESCDDHIIAFSVHASSDLGLMSHFNSKLFVARDLTDLEERRIIADFLAFLEKNQNAILTSYNLLDFDLPLLYSRLRRYYPLGFLLSSIIQNFSLYDTMIAFKAHTMAELFCGLKKAIEQLTCDGHGYFYLNTKLAYSGKDAFSLWLKERQGVSKEFSEYIVEDSYNHMRLAQFLLLHNINEGLWYSGSSVVVEPSDECEEEISNIAVGDEYEYPDIDYEEEYREWGEDLPYGYEEIMEPQDDQTMYEPEDGAVEKLWRYADFTP